MTLNNVLADFELLIEQFISKLPNLGLGLFICFIFFFLAGPISRIFIKPLNKTSASPLIQIVIRRVISLFIMLIGGYIFLTLAGLTKFAVALISGTGVVGLIVGFAFKDIAENFLSSLLLSVQRPFKLGDIIEVSGYLGVVNKMTSRATTLVDFNGDHIQLPNATIYKSTIRNLTANPNMRGTVKIGIGYDADISYAQGLALTKMQDIDAILKEPEPQVLVESLGSSTINLKLLFWVDNEKSSKLKVASVIMKKVVEAFTLHGISMPDDARERIIMNASNIFENTAAAEESINANRKENNSKVGDNKTDINNTDKNNAEKINAEKFQAKNTQTKNIISLNEEDTSSENDDIREQAAKSRDPEQGENIL